MTRQLIRNRNKLNSDCDFEAIDVLDDQDTALESCEMNHSMTLMYVLIEAGRRQAAEGNNFRLRNDIGLSFPMPVRVTQANFVQLLWIQIF